MRLKCKNAILVSSVIFGLIICCIDAVYHFRITYSKVSLFEVLFPGVLSHEFFVRALIMSGFFICGLVASIAFGRYDDGRKRELELETRYRDYYNKSSLGYQSLDGEGRFVDANPAFLETLGYSKEEVIGKWFKDFLPSEYQKVFEESFSRFVTQGKIQGLNLEMVCRDGHHVLFEINGSVEYDERGNFRKTHCVLTDITERKKAEEELRQTMKQKEVLLKEVQHRVKNNMMVLDGLMSLQQNAITGGEDCWEMLNQARQRVQAMGKAYQALYKAEDLLKVDLSEYIESIVVTLGEAYGAKERKISISVDVGPEKFDISIATSYGLIVNELFVNVFKHAFPERESGNILISLEEKEGFRELQVRDDGVGLGEEIILDEIKTLGMRLILMLTHQLKGKFSYKRENGWSIFSIVSTESVDADGKG